MTCHDGGANLPELKAGDPTIAPMHMPSSKGSITTLLYRSLALTACSSDSLSMLCGGLAIFQQEHDHGHAKCKPLIVWHCWGFHALLSKSCTSPNNISTGTKIVMVDISGCKPLKPTLSAMYAPLSEWPI